MPNELPNTISTGQPGDPIRQLDVWYDRPTAARVTQTQARSTEAPDADGFWPVLPTAAGVVSIAFLTPMMAGQDQWIELRLRPGSAAALRIEVHGAATRYQKAVAIIASTGGVLDRGSELTSLATEVDQHDQSIVVRLSFTPYRSLVEWVYVIAQDAACIGREDPPVFSWAAYRAGSRRSATAFPQVEHRPARWRDGVLFACQALLQLRNYVHIDFEIHRPGATLTGMRLEGARALTGATWWTSAPVALSAADFGQDAESKGQMVRFGGSPKIALRSPALMDALGPDHSNHGNCVVAMFADHLDLRHESVEESDALGRFVLRARFDDGAEISLSVPPQYDLQEKPWEIVDWHLERYARAFAGRAFLDVGARGDTGRMLRNRIGGQWQYKSLDYTEGPNVDVVADAHTLSRLLPLKSIDVVHSYMVVEHLSVPWRFVLEANKILRIDGLFIAVAPWAIPLHGEPWDFFRPSIHAWSSLLNASTGFEIVELVEIEASAMILHAASPSGTNRAQYDPAPLGTMVVARKISDTNVEWTAYREEAVIGSYNPA